MNCRERVKAAMHYKPVDKVPLQYYYCPVGYYEHGDKLNDLYASLPGDFEPFRRMPIIGPAPEDIDGQGRYHHFEEDEWGVVWEKRIFGVAGIPYRRPLEDMEKLEGYRPPRLIMEDREAVGSLKAHYEKRRQQGFYALHGCGGLYERLIALCGDENALCGMALEDENLDRIADMIAERARSQVECAVFCGADGISLGDDYGSERSLMMSPALWRRFIRPRLQYIMEPAVRKRLDIHFHSCGYVWDILPDLKELGVTSIWPQLPAYNMKELAQYCRELQLAVAVHTDRANTMTYGKPQDVRELVMREYETFRMNEGGAWFYVEADNGFPYENLEALVRTIAEWR